MMIEDINIYLFHCINATTTPNPIAYHLAVFLSHNVIGLFIGFLIILLFFKGKDYKSLFVKTLLTVGIALLMKELIELFYYHPRPFELHLGQKLIGHGSTSSFPSSHTLTMSTIAFAFLLGGYRKIGVLGLILGLCVGWSRVYLGVHFPLDVIGSFVIAFATVMGTNLFLKEFALRVRKYFQPPLSDTP